MLFYFTFLRYLPQEHPALYRTTKYKIQAINICHKTTEPYMIDSTVKVNTCMECVCLHIQSTFARQYVYVVYMHTCKILYAYTVSISRVKNVSWIQFYVNGACVCTNLTYFIDIQESTNKATEEIYSTQICCSRREKKGALNFCCEVHSSNNSSSPCGITVAFMQDFQTNNICWT